MQEIRITANDAGRRLDRFLRKYLPNASLSTIYRLIRKDVKVNGHRQANGYVLGDGDTLTLYAPDTAFMRWRQRDERAPRHARRDFGIIYEDAHVLIADKPKGLLTHGDRQEKRNHLANQVQDYLIETAAYDPRASVFAPAPANRLDRNTSGLVLFGKDSAALRALTARIRHRQIDKYYQSIVYGRLETALELCGRLSKDASLNQASILPASAAEGRPIETHIRPIELLGDCTLVEIHLITGRTHQIRAHLASIGHPVLGDRKYTAGTGLRQADALNRHLQQAYGLRSQLLHSSRVHFADADDALAYLNGRSYKAPLPEPFQQMIQTLRRK